MYMNDLTSNQAFCSFSTLIMRQTTAEKQNWYEGKIQNDNKIRCLDITDDNRLDWPTHKHMLRNYIFGCFPNQLVSNSTGSNQESRRLFNMSNFPWKIKNDNLCGFLLFQSFLKIMTVRMKMNFAGKMFGVARI